MSGLKKRFLQRMGNRDRDKSSPGCATAATGSGSDSPSNSSSSKSSKRDKKRRKDKRSSSLEEALMSPWRLVFSTGVDSSGCSSVESGGEDGASVDSLYFNDSPVFTKRQTSLSPLLAKQSSMDGAAGGIELLTEEVGIEIILHYLVFTYPKRFMNDAFFTDIIRVFCKFKWIPNSGRLCLLLADSGKLGKIYQN